MRPWEHIWNHEGQKIEHRAIASRYERPILTTTCPTRFDPTFVQRVVVNRYLVNQVS
jgi:hypothetical protein